MLPSNMTFKTTQNSPFLFRFKSFLSFLKKNSWNILLQIGIWLTVYYVWRIHTHMRHFSSSEKEFYTFWLIFTAVYVNRWVILKYIYQFKKAIYYILGVSLLLLSITLIEYFYVIDSILEHLDDVDLENPEIVRNTKLVTFVGTLMRDFVILSFSSLIDLYRDALQVKKHQKAEIEYLERIRSMQIGMINYMGHEHLAENALSMIISHIPEDAKDMKNLGFRLLDIYRYSFSQITQSLNKISAEVKFAKTLVDYYQIKYPLPQVEFKITGEISPFSIPPLITEPIIGNAFKHGLTDENGLIIIEFDFTDPLLFKMICKNKWKPQKTSPINPNSRGLKILKNRLELTYKAQASFSFETEGDWVVASLAIIP